MNNPLRPADESINAVIDGLRERAPHVAPKPAGHYVTGAAWMPELEDESAAFPLRLKGLDALAGYRHALAVTQGAWPRRIEGRVLVRDRASDRVYAFNARFVGPDLLKQKLEAVHCCRACGCTEDRACAGGCAWAEPDLCTACAERSHG